MKALFLGLGGVGQRHLRNLLQLRPDVRLAAVRHGDRAFEIGYDLQPDYSVDIMEKYGIQRLADLDEALAWKPDLAVVASPTSAHMEQATALARGGVPVFLEKPVSADHEGLDDLVRLASRPATPVMVGYMFRFHPGVRRFLELVRERAAGRPHTMHVQLNSYMPAWHSYEKYNEFYAGRKDLGGGAVLSEIHELDLISAMLGEPHSVHASGGTLSSLELDVEDTACALLEFGVDGRPFPVTLQMSFVQRPPTRRITLYAENGTIEWQGMTSCITLRGTDGTETVEDFSSFERNQMFLDELEHFLHCLERGETPLTNLPDVAGGHRLALQIRDALA
ncbi:Predicted dehydrogenase [Paucidesulfovibrio gracilis DSM 16080]|uniref:Predicted dehydrogenase n=1 Tax=Paucidesulfovibrio gracilis DSM 16080 TaxID=1121449 RepID=A0A1T4X3H9_9BACT|nr:Gfo/Idh/MocA family oxidoreductase [Paucidesulfovibrio gracilis]SKA83708.1 Predicted dehydrogenase [Paucidesulfovibrio gracilis DSM 16080]